MFWVKFQKITYYWEHNFNFNYKFYKQTDGWPLSVSDKTGA